MIIFCKTDSFQENLTKCILDALRYLLKEMVLESKRKTENILL